MPAAHVPALDGAARSRLIDRFGPEVAGWCDDLPRLVDSVGAAWRLRVRRRLPPGGTSVLFECVAGTGDPVVLKLTPDPRIAAGEAAALAAWAGSVHVVGLLDTDLDRGVLLLECLRPGVPLAEDPAGWTPADIAPVLVDLWSPRPRPAATEVVPPLRERVAFLFDLTRRRLLARPGLDRHLPPDLLDRSRRRALALADGGSVGLVHGDLHPGNVLRTGRGAVAIDPRPCVGDRAFDAVDWVLVGAADRPELDRRADRLAALTGVDPERVLAWCRAVAVLLAVGVLRRDAADPRARLLLHVAAGTTPPPR